MDQNTNLQNEIKEIKRSLKLELEIIHEKTIYRLTITMGIMFIFLLWYMILIFY